MPKVKYTRKQLESMGLTPFQDKDGNQIYLKPYCPQEIDEVSGEYVGKRVHDRNQRVSLARNALNNYKISNPSSTYNQGASTAPEVVAKQNTSQNMGQAVKDLEAKTAKQVGRIERSAFKGYAEPTNTKWRNFGWKSDYIKSKGRGE